MKPLLTIGPVLFHWQEDKWRDFYFRMADEADVDCVYVGEAVCSKRIPFYEPLYEDVSIRLKKAGKKVVFSTLAEITIARDSKHVEKLCKRDDLIEANDACALWHLTGRPHTIGPFMNVYNEDSLTLLALNSAEHVCLPPELPAQAMSAMARRANGLVVSLEVQIYGRLPLALSARCYHARAHGLVKDNCQFVCGKDPDGMELKTLQGKPFLTINGIQTMSHTCLNLVQELEEIKNMGITHFRLSPHSHDMVETAAIFRAALDCAIPSEEASVRLKENCPDMPFSNGFYHKIEGYRWKDAT